MRRLTAPTLPLCASIVLLLHASPQPLWAQAAPTGAAMQGPALWQWLTLGLAAAALGCAIMGLLRLSRLRKEGLRARAAEQRLLAMTTILPGGLFQARHTPGGAPKFLYLDSRLHETLHLPLQEMLENAEALPLHPEDRQRLERQWGYAATPGGAMHFTGRLLTDGGQRWCQIMAGVHQGPAGELVYSGVMLDVSQQKRSEEALLEQERRLRTLAENLPGAIYRCLHDEERTMLYISDGIQDLAGHPSADFIGGLALSISDIIHPDDLPALTKHITEAVDDNRGYACEYRIRTPQGHTRWIYDKGQGVRSELDPDDVLWLDGLMLDISAQKQAEEAMLQAKQLADQANQAKGEFLARMSHEIRTPMNAVLGMCHLALQTELTHKQRDYLNKLQAAASSLLGVINDILDFSKIEAGRLEMESLPFRLENVLDNLANLISLPAEAKGLDFRVITDHDVPTALQGDPLRLGQVLVNLANNAVKFTEQGFVEVHVSTEQREQPGQPADAAHLLFEIRDSGIGLSQEQISRLFESFTQADGSITRKYGGTGLGLAICKRLVELMHGEIGVTSEPGKGACFHFTARFALPQEIPPLASDHAQMHSDASRLQRIRGARVLLADDSEINRQIAGELLQQAGLQVDCAGSGRQVLDMTSKRQYDAIFMDVQMPEMDGLEATRQLRKRGCSTPILAMTAHAMAEARQQCLQAGMDDHIPKPIAPERLHEALLRWIPPQPEGQGSSRMDTAPLQLSPDATTEDLPAIPGLDTAAGLKSLSGNRKLYGKLLRQFAEGHADAAASIRQALDDGDTAAAAALAHKTKGVAASLGAIELSQTAARLETDCRVSSPSELWPLLEEFSRQLEHILQELQAFFRNSPSSVATAPASSSDPGRILALVEIISQALERDLNEALQGVEQLRPLCPQELAAHFLALEQALAVFDIDAAALALEGLRETIGKQET